MRAIVEVMIDCFNYRKPYQLEKELRILKSTAFSFLLLLPIPHFSFFALFMLSVCRLFFFSFRDFPHFQFMLYVILVILVCPEPCSLSLSSVFIFKNIYEYSLFKYLCMCMFIQMFFLSSWCILYSLFLVLFVRFRNHDAGRWLWLLCYSFQLKSMNNNAKKHEETTSQTVVNCSKLNQ